MSRALKIWAERRSVSYFRRHSMELDNTRSTITGAMSPCGRFMATSHGDHAIRVSLFSCGPGRGRPAGSAVVIQVRPPQRNRRRCGLHLTSRPRWYCQTLSGHARTPWCVKFHPRDSNLLVSGCLSGRGTPAELRVWDVAAGKVLHSCRTSAHVLSIAFHPTAPLVVCATGRRVCVWPYTVRYNWGTACAAG